MPDQAEPEVSGKHAEGQQMLQSPPSTAVWSGGGCSALAPGGTQPGWEDILLAHSLGPSGCRAAKPVRSGWL